MIGDTEAFRGIVRSFATKMPTFYYSAFPTVKLFSTYLMSEPNFKLMLDDWIWNRVDGTGTSGATIWAAYVEKLGFEWIDGLPKSTLWVKLNPDISTGERDFILNGIRINMDRTDIVLDKKDLTDALDSINMVFSIFVLIISAIALFISFFLLLIAMTQNINEAIWEYGVLRSMGLTESEGRRVFMYEAFMIVVAATILGIASGTACALLISNQFFMFIEMPSYLEFPYVSLGMMLGIAGVTTWIAVYRPVRLVNRKQIATVLKGGA